MIVIISYVVLICRLKDSSFAALVRIYISWIIFNCTETLSDNLPTVFSTMYINSIQLNSCVYTFVEIITRFKNDIRYIRSGLKGISNIIAVLKFNL